MFIELNIVNEQIGLIPTVINTNNILSIYKYGYEDSTYIKFKNMDSIIVKESYETVKHMVGVPSMNVIKTYTKVEWCGRRTLNEIREMMEKYGMKIGDRLW